MQLFTPESGILLWSLLAIINLLLCIVAVIKLVKHPISPATKFAFIVAILFIPFVGALTFFVLIKGSKSAKI